MNRFEITDQRTPRVKRSIRLCYQGFLFLDPFHEENTAANSVISNYSDRIRSHACIFVFLLHVFLPPSTRVIVYDDSTYIIHTLLIFDWVPDFFNQIGWI